jgi:hypothetical protein
MDARLRNSGMTEKTTVRSQFLVNFNINFIIMRKVTDCQALKPFIYNLYATGRFIELGGAG